MQLRTLLAIVLVSTGISAHSQLLDTTYPETDNAVFQVLEDLPNNRLFVAGLFTQIGGVPRSHLAMLDATTKAVLPWDPGVVGLNVIKMELSGNTLYVGGIFTAIGGQPRNGLAALNATSGAVLPWDPQADVANVQTILLDGTRMLVGGTFTNIGGQARSGFAAVDLAIGLATPFDPNPTGYLPNVVYTIIRDSGSLFVVGDFNSIGGLPRGRLAKLDATTGAALTWYPNVTDLTNIVVHAGLVYLHGGFTNVNGQPRNRLAAVDATTGALTAWDPGTDDVVYTAAVWNGQLVVSGAFSNVSGAFRPRLAAVDLGTGLPSSWNPTPNSATGGFFSVGQERLYFGGTFQSISFQARSGLAVYTVPPPCTENLVLEIRTDANPNETEWYIVEIGTANIVASGPSGGPYPANAVITENICLPAACYELLFYDNGNNGITGGGYVLRTAANRRIIDSRDNGAFGDLSQIAANQGFCTSTSTQTLTVATTDREDLLPTSNIIAGPNAAVNAQFGVGNQADDGYQFWVFDPHGSYSVMRFQSHANPGAGGGAGATAPCYLRLNSMAGLPLNLLLNVRVRNRVNGINSDWGPASRLRVLVGAPPCPLAQMVNAGMLNSCNVNKVAGGSQKLYCYNIAGGDLYRFELRNDAEGYVRLTNGNNNALVLANWIANPLLCGTHIYQVRAQASFDNGLTWCPFGSACEVIIANNPPSNCTAPVGGGGNLLAVGDEPSGLRIYPNPTNEGRISLTLDGIHFDAQAVHIHVFDLLGKQCVGSTIHTDGASELTTVVELPSTVLAGLYIVRVSDGTRQYQQRLVVQ